MPFQVSADTGGTFIDVVIQDSQGAQYIGKSLTTHERVFTGLEKALSAAAEQVGKSAREVLEDTALFIYGTTRATNAIVTRNIAKTALLATEGFPDILVLKEGGKIDGSDYTKNYPDPYIPRRHTFEVPGRIAAQGNVVVDLDEESVRRTLVGLGEAGFEAIAVSFLWSIMNPSHELRVGELIQEVLPGIPYSLSHQVAPIVREYRRTSAVAIDASLKPLMQSHFRALEHDLREFGYRSEILVSSSMGGVMSIDEVIASPIQAARSGPSMAPLAGLNYSRLEGFGSDMIVADTGGTTFDVGLSRDGELVYSRDAWIGAPWEGDLLGISAVDIRSIGAGGGSIAWVDDGGLLRVGPQSAGSEPGPACYGRGGTEPTLSDAVTVLGYFDPEYFLGGRMDLDVAAAENAIGKIAAQLGVGIYETAWGILTLASESMVKAVHEITVSQGLNPEESTLVAGGGAAGINIMQIAAELGSKRVVLPKVASALSASGMHFADIVKEESAALVTTSRDFAAERVTDVLEKLEAKLGEFAAKFSDRYPNYRVDFGVEARYASQVWNINVPLPKQQFLEHADRQALFEAFHAVHERILGVRDHESAIEFLSWKAKVSVELPHAETDYVSVSQKPATPSGHRTCFFGDGEILTPIYKPDQLPRGATVSGPAVIEEATTTLVVFPGMSAEVSGAGNYLLHINEEAGQ